MSLDLTKQITERAFSSAANVHEKGDGTLESAIRGTLQEDAREKVRALNAVDLVDNSAGAGGVVFTADDSTDEITLEVASGLQTGDGPFRLANTGGALPGGLAAGADFWVVRESATVFQLATSRANALAGTVVDVTSAGSGTHFLLALKDGPELSSNDLTGLTTGVTAASANAAADTVMDAYATLVERANLVLAELDAGAAAEGPGTAGGGTIAAIDDTATANTDDTDAASFDSVRAVRQDLEDSQRTVVDLVNVCRRAVGLGPVPEAGVVGQRSSASASAPVPADAEGAGRSTKGRLLSGHDLVAISDAANVDPPTAAVLLAEWDAFVDHLADNVAFLADQLDEVTEAGGKVAVQVPFFLPQTEYAAGTAVNVISPVAGRIRSARTVVMDEVTSGAAAVTLAVNGVAVTGASVTIADASVIGAFDEDAVADTATNVVRRGDVIAVSTDGTPTAGAAFGFVEIELESEGKKPAAFAG